MVVTVKRLERYLHCPLQERFLVREARKSIQEEWEEALGSVIRWFFFQLLDARRPDREELLSRWDKVWFKGKRPLEVMVKGLDQRAQWGIRGVRLLDHFFRHVHPVPGRPLAVGQPVSIQLGPVELQGEIPLVREVTEGGKRIVEIVHYRTGSIPDSMFWIESDLEVAFASWAFRHIQQSREDRSRMVYLLDGKEVTLEVTDGLRRRFLHILRHALPGIAKGEVWPRQGPHCRACPYKKPCADIDSWRD